MINKIPHEIAINGVYISPLILVLIMAFIFTFVTTIILNKVRVSQFIFLPQYAFLAIMLIYVVIIDTYLIKF